MVKLKYLSFLKQLVGVFHDKPREIRFYESTAGMNLLSPHHPAGAKNVYEIDYASSHFEKFLKHQEIEYHVVAHDKESSDIILILERALDECAHNDAQKEKLLSLAKKF